MDLVTQAIEWSQIRLEIRGKKLDDDQLEVLNFAFQNVREQLSKLHQPTVISMVCDCENKVYDRLMSGEVKCLRCGKMIA